MWLARLTSSDHTSYCHFRSPRTPDNTRPVWMPIRMSTFAPVASRTSLKQLRRKRCQEANTINRDESGLWPKKTKPANQVEIVTPMTNFCLNENPPPLLGLALSGNRQKMPEVRFELYYHPYVTIPCTCFILLKHLRSYKNGIQTNPLLSYTSWFLDILFNVNAVSNR